MIIKMLVVSPFQENCYIIASEKTRRGFVIDPGDEIDRIISAIEKENLTIEKIINTHAHIDHVAGVQELKEKLNIPFYMHEDDLPLLHTLPQQAMLYGMRTLGTPEVDGFLEEGDTISLDDIKFKVIHTPGHSPGGVCFIEKDFVIAGDTLFAGSIGRTDLPGGNHERLIHSIKTKLMTLDENLTVYSGHGPQTTIGEEKQTNPFLV